MTSILMLSFLSAAAVGFSSCSDDDEKDASVEKEDVTDGLPQDLADKIHAIYGQASIEPQTVTTVHQLAILTSVCASLEGRGPITVTPAKLNDKEITLVTLGGTQEVAGQATTMKESQLASFGKPNDYLAAVERLFENGIVPAGKPVLLTGISLGGMIAQQVLGVESITSRFQLEGIITFGSPITLPINRKGVKVVRFADVNDKVPQLGEMPLRSGMVSVAGLDKSEIKALIQQLDDTERVARKSKYAGMIETHALSYVEDACWNDVDFMGDSKKNHKLELKETMKFYAAPKSGK